MSQKLIKFANLKNKLNIQVEIAVEGSSEQLDEEICNKGFLRTEAEAKHSDEECSQESKHIDG